MTTRSAQPQVAIVGAGLMGRWHAHACRRAGGRVAAVVDADIDAARQLARALGASAAAASLEGVPPDVRLDAVHVCTPPESHAGQIRAALSRGRGPVIVEKPLAPTAELTEALIAVAREAGTWLQPVHQIVFQAGVARALRWAADGPIRSVDYVVCSAGADACADSADAVVADILPHPLSLIDVLLPDALDTMLWEARRTAPGEWQLTSSTGTTAIRVLISMHARPTRHDLAILGDRGTVIADLFHGFAWRRRGRPSRLSKAASPFASAVASSCSAALNLGRRAWTREPAYPGLNALVAQTYAARHDPARRPLSDRHTMAVARARDRILQQVLRG